MSLPCIFTHGEDAVVRYELSEGCDCYPDRVQDRCAQHAYDLESNGSFAGTCEAVARLDPDWPWPSARGFAGHALLPLIGD